MKTCRFEQKIDDYLLGRIKEEEKAEFEEHYFNCASCFQKTRERDQLIGVIKSSESLFAEQRQPAGEASPAPWYDRVFAFLTPKQWALAGAAAALVLITVFTIIPNGGNVTPKFVLNGEETVRGESLTLISPVIDIAVIPPSFEWKKLGDDLEYSISIYNHDLLWKATTRDNRIVLPDEIRAKMSAGQKYSWQVRAFSEDGTLIAVSSRVQFQIKPAE
jgi:hypothetical protein